MKQRGGSYMSYESVVGQVKSIPEKYLPVVSDFLSYIQYKVGVIKNNDSDIPKHKKDFIGLAGKIHLDADEAKKFREESLI